MATKWPEPNGSICSMAWDLARSKRAEPLGSVDIVAPDFNPGMKIYIVALDFNPGMKVDIVTP